MQHFAFPPIHLPNCRELYGMVGRGSFPSTGATYDMHIKASVESPPPQWQTNWDNGGTMNCAGRPSTNITEVHNSTSQDVTWELFW